MGDIYHRDEEGDAPSDSRLLKLVAAGDEQAFTVLYQRHHVALFNFILRLIHERPVAEELLQETFVAVWRGSGRFRGRARVKTWMFRIAHNSAVSWLRRNSRTKLAYDQIEIPEQPGPEAFSLASWNRRQIREALDQLSANHRAVIELAFVHELSYAEIAQVMDCPVGTVKSRMSYALRRMERLLIWQEILE